MTTIDGGDGRCPILFQRQCLGDPEYLARRNVANHDLLTLRRRLLDAQMSMQQDEKRLGICALIEYGSILRKFHGAGLLQNLVDFTGSKPCERRDVGHDRAVYGRHLLLFAAALFIQWNHGESPGTLR